VNLILLTPQDYITGNIALLKDRRFTHIAQVHRSGIGDTVRVGELDGTMGTARIEAIDARQVQLAVSLGTPAPAKLPLTLVLALPRPKMLRRIIRSVGELGIEQVIIINSYRVDKSFWKSPALAADCMRRDLIDGLQQARDTVLPRVQCKRLFRPFVEDELPGLVQGKQALVAHPGGDGVPVTVHTPTLLAIGPEGGFIDYEIDQLHAAGLSTLNFGPRIYRVENAVSFAVGKLFG
jgi:RsmE family RNA methyltransferase